MINRFDTYIIRVVQMLPKGLHGFMIFITNALSPAACIVILLVTMVITLRHKNKRLFVTELVLLVAQPLAAILKVLTKRVRPNTVYVEHLIIKSYSFPSGHAYAAMLVLGFLAYLASKYLHDAWKWIVPIFLTLLIFLVGISRVYLGAHFPTDVLAGWLLGGIILVLVIKLRF